MDGMVQLGPFLRYMLLDAGDCKALRPRRRRRRLRFRRQGVIEAGALPERPQERTMQSPTNSSDQLAQFVAEVARLSALVGDPALAGRLGPNLVL
ncbi:hypothetical protein ACFONC_03235 [Luteimonas soli]|uniref:Uncharacterized protein n=1 Tax=Luteimonas soli TaxID=1648966 RepID=A0ABV7XJB4_9GAMM